MEVYDSTNAIEARRDDISEMVSNLKPQDVTAMHRYFKAGVAALALRERAAKILCPV
ncbi:MAG: hypothetical protein WCK05_14560 [Planctomycetota bacterium]